MKKLAILSLIVVLVLFFSTCVNNDAPDTDASTETLTEVSFNIPSTYTMPYEVGPGPDAGKYDNHTALALFAWQEMIALNWKSNFAQTQNRDEPDNSWNYSIEGTPDHVIWETFAHRTELRPATPHFDSLLPPLKGLPFYSFGTKNKTVRIEQASSTTKLNLFNCLDEDNEIGSSILFAHAGDALSSIGGDNDNQVLYQAKINKTGYDYRRQYFPGRQSLLNAATLVTSNGSPDSTKLKGHTASCDTESLSQQGYICFPCASASSEGVIEIKTAWRKKRSGDDLSTYFWREALYFTGVSEESATAHNDTFLLIGMHINHKTTDVPTFVIATFEHEDLRADNYRYLGTPGSDADYSELYQIKDASSIERNKHMSIYDPINAEVHQTLAGEKANSYLQHYNLVGVQGEYIDGYASATEFKSASFLLSNYAIETNEALANFYGSFGLPQRGNADGFFNLITKEGKAIVAGGCKGCHGVTQTGGTDMSFLMDGTKPADMPDEASLSQAAILADYLMPGLILKKGNSFFFSYYQDQMIDNDKGAYVGLSSQNSDLVLFPYERYQQENQPIDLDGYPFTNFSIKSYNAANGAITLQHVALDGSTTGNVSIDRGNNNQLIVGSADAEVFTLTQSSDKYGFVQLQSSDGSPIVLLDGTTLAAQKNMGEAVYLGIEVYRGEPFNKMN